MFKLRLVQVQRQRLTIEQKTLLKQLLQLKKLQDPEIPEARRGVEGILAAHQWLLENDSKGILIGGLSSKIWSPKGQPHDLSSSKDVDVLILPDCPCPKKQFEAGIDWWVAHEKEVYITSDTSSMNVRRHFFENGYGTVLNFSLTLPYHDSDELPNGLILPGRNMSIGMHLALMNGYADHQIDERIAKHLVRKHGIPGKSLHPQLVEFPIVEAYPEEKSIYRFAADFISCTTNSTDSVAIRITNASQRKQTIDSYVMATAISPEFVYAYKKLSDPKIGQLPSQLSTPPLPKESVPHPEKHSPDKGYSKT